MTPCMFERRRLEERGSAVEFGPLVEATQNQDAKAKQAGLIWGLFWAYFGLVGLFGLFGLFG